MHLPTHQSGVENRGKVYPSVNSICAHFLWKKSFILHESEKSFSYQRLSI